MWGWCPEYRLSALEKSSHFVVTFAAASLRLTQNARSTWTFPFDLFLTHCCLVPEVTAFRSRTSSLAQFNMQSHIFMRERQVISLPQH